MSSKVENLNKGFLERNADALRAAGINVEAHLPLDLSEELPKDLKDEEDLQQHCENYLRRHGGERMTATASVDVASGKRPAPTFWFGHVRQRTKARGVIMPLLPDLMLIDPATMNILLVELKVTSKYRPGQKEHIESGLWKECRTVEDFIAIFWTWRVEQQ